MYLKRCFDFGVALVALVLLAPLMIGLAICVLVFIGRPIFFKQQRPGYRGRPFQMFKFRTMSDACTPDGRPLSDSARLMSFGRILRSTSLDELPELINIIRGDMSFVGPRPLLMEYLPLYNVEQARRHSVKPGLTGWVQVNGRNTVSWDEKFALDIWYVENQSFLLDMKIMLLTILKVLKREGIAQEGLATTEPFRGNRD